MSNPDSTRPRRNEAEPAPNERMQWALPLGLAAAILIVAAIIFSSAGPDRTRTAANNNLNSKPVAGEQAAETAIPKRSGDATAPAQQAPARSNPSGTQ